MLVLVWRLEFADLRGAPEAKNCLHTIFDLESASVMGV
jgi:hypothetical protein